MVKNNKAEASVLEALPRLQSMGVRTKRPDDYFAQMAKTDAQMNKIRQKLVSKQVSFVTLCFDDLYNFRLVFYRQFTNNT